MVTGFHLHHRLLQSNNYSIGLRSLMDYKCDVKLQVLLAQQVQQVQVLVDHLHRIYLGILKVYNIKFHFHIVHKRLQNIVDHMENNLAVQLV